jgi:hypothetical protein
MKSMSIEPERADPVEVEEEPNNERPFYWFFLLIMFLRRIIDGISTRTKR